MIAKEFIRIRLYDALPVVLDWLNTLPEAATKQSPREFRVIELAAQEDAEPSLSARLRFGITARRPRSSNPGALVVTALLAAESAEATLAEIRCSAAFPLSAHELIDSLRERHRFHVVDLLAVPEQSGKGAPPLACNAWLEEELRCLPNPQRYHHLFQPWLERYIVLRGRAPAEPRRSFRSAAWSGLARMGMAKNPPRRRNARS